MHMAPDCVISYINCMAILSLADQFVTRKHFLLRKNNACWLKKGRVGYDTSDIICCLADLIAQW